jgi:hypothetical protein
MNKKSPHFEDAGKAKNLPGKDSKKFLVNMPKKLGLVSGKKYYFVETKNGYSLNFGRGLWIGMPKVLIENNPQLYTLIQKGGQR